MVEKRQFSVRAVPNEGAPSYYRVGHRFGPEPVIVTVLEKPQGPYEITEAQLVLLQADSRINLGPVTAVSKPAATVAQDAEQKRLEEAAKDAEKHNQRGR